MTQKKRLSIMNPAKTGVNSNKNSELISTNASLIVTVSRDLLWEFRVCLDI